MGFSVCDLGSQWSLQDGSFTSTGCLHAGMGAFTPVRSEWVPSRRILWIPETIAA
ncbi:hypothetical protein FH972_012252 [Carpinus fangiana]|uniref:Uncharacterized protein n=1 Tax=Carpinus fangiana TaxID=176857 RepID=A0A5N6R399_9ROSI|nr:hypothetical protein FH972_010015 [Carpinus fangiana]KAE8055412.1 hypothetical protein FH972_012252 [Carpinus fangiana]